MLRERRKQRSEEKGLDQGEGPAGPGCFTVSPPTAVEAAPAGLAVPSPSPRPDHRLAHLGALP